jgi:hypothetical protein
MADVLRQVACGDGRTLNGAERGEIALVDWAAVIWTLLSEQLRSVRDHVEDSVGHAGILESDVVPA